MHRFFSDLLIGHMQDLAASELLEHHAALSENDTVHHHRKLHQHHQGQHVLGPPLQKDNWANLTEACILGSEFQTMVRPGQASPSLTRASMPAC